MWASVRVEIVRYTDDHQPGFVECRLTDMDGRDWSFVEKVPVVSDVYLDADSPYPCGGSVSCFVLSRIGDVLCIGVDSCTDYFECCVRASALTE